MPLAKNKLNEMFWAGYCDATIKHAAATSNDGQGRDRRMQWAQAHYNHCPQCKLANIIKALEYETAAVMGPEMVQLFQQGGDIVGLPGFREAFEQTIERAINQGIVSPRVHDFMTAAADRHGADWPGLSEVEVAPVS